MEVKQKIETRMLHTEDGGRLLLDYCLLAHLDEPNQCLTGPYGIEIVLRCQEGERRDACRNMTVSRKKALALIHIFAAHAVLPSGMRKHVGSAG